ncbi:MAG: cupin domain-containing protein [Haloferacaceae archaeon]
MDVRAVHRCVTDADPDLAATEFASLADLDARPHADAFGPGGPRTVRLALDADEAVPEHTHPDRTVVVAVLEGELTLSIDGEEHDLAAGDLARFDGRRSVAPRARTDATALVVLSPAAGREAGD